MGSGGRRRPLADVGPHPNPSKAAAGQRIHRLEPDPVTAPVVERICAMFGVDELGLRAIAETLTAEGIPSPSTPPRGRTSWAALLAGRFGSSLYLLLPGRSDLPRGRSEASAARFAVQHPSLPATSPPRPARRYGIVSIP